MQPNYLYYPKILQQGGNNFGSAITDLNDQRRLKPELFYQPYPNYVEEKTCSHKFLKAFSYLPCFPSSWSQSTRGAIGFGIFLFFISLIIVALGLIPVYLTLGSNVDKNEFSIDVANGLKLQNQNLAGILSQANEANRTLDQNITLTNEINSLMTQLTARFRNLNPNVEKIYNIRLTPDSDQSINVSYSIKTKPLAKSEMSDLQNRLNSMINDQTNFNQLSLANSTISVNENINDIKISDPVVGEFQAKSSILLSNSKSPSLKSDSSSTGLGINGKKKSDLMEELKLIQSYSKIKFLKDGDDYMKKYPIYFPKYEPNHAPDEYQAYPEPYTEPYYPQEHDQYSKPKYQPDYTEQYYPEEHDQYSKPKYQPEYTEKYEQKPEKYESYSKESHAHKKNEHKKKSKSKLKDEKPVLKSETFKANSNKTHIELKKQRVSAEVTDANDSEFDQSMQDSVEETKKETKVTKPIKEEIKLKSVEKLNEEDKIKNIEKIKENNKENEKIDSETILKIVTGHESEKAVRQEKLISSTREIEVTEKKKSD
ncbi:hypothetical protein BpHYR1_047168 [Brachionus plicatilis]|uniref:Uncharacterized protein n=1 Tax=Brachionus plicatilis TaxID=10195 RepID=A0A3M7S2A7_BRAPC|nr:hypothetical protein BpHYR1_047168 [Brachionus plicatilis]